jgi:hypothetical protein
MQLAPLEISTTRYFHHYWYCYGYYSSSLMGPDGSSLFEAAAPQRSRILVQVQN